MSADETLAIYLGRIYGQRRSSVVASLRDLADRIERTGPTPNLKDLKIDYLADARAILHDIAWGVAGLSLDDLVGRAAEAHAAERAP